MQLAEQIFHTVESLPETRQREVLDFVGYLKMKTEHKEEQTWRAFSLASAVQGIEEEPEEYSVEDLQERF